MIGPAPKCLYCGKRLRLAPKYIRVSGRALTADGAPPTHGYEGNNVMCSSRCGLLVALALLRADPGVMAILPPGWNQRPGRTA